MTVEFTVMGIACLGLNGGPDPAAAKRAFDAMMQMQRIDMFALLPITAPAQEPVSIESIAAGYGE